MAGKLGKQPATKDDRDIKFSALVKAAGVTLPKPPPTFGHGQIYHDGEAAGDWMMNGNGPDDTVHHGFQGAGDCVFACGAHTTRESAKLGGHTLTITGKESIADYSAVTGYVVDDDNTDQGTNMRDAMKYRAKTGLVDAHGSRHKIGAYVSINPNDWVELFQACYLFSAVEIGFQFQAAQYDQFDSGTWDYDPSSQIEGGHAIPAFGRNHNRAGVVSWAKHLWITQAFYEQLNDETWAIVYPEELKNGVNERGFDLSHLNAALAALR